MHGRVMCVPWDTTFFGDEMRKTIDQRIQLSCSVPPFDSILGSSFVASRSWSATTRTTSAATLELFRLRNANGYRTERGYATVDGREHAIFWYRIDITYRMSCNYFSAHDARRLSRIRRPRLLPPRPLAFGLFGGSAK